MSENHWRQGGSRGRYRIGGPTVGADLGRHVDEETAAAFALGALDAAEWAEVERHRRLCASCAALVDRDLATAGALAYTARPISPSPMTKAALFARVAHAQRAAAEVTLPTPVATTLPPALTIPASRSFAATSATSVDADRPAAFVPAPASRFGRFGAYLSLPLLVALLAIGGWGWNQWSNVAALSSSVADLNAKVAAKDAQLSVLAAGYASDTQTTFALSPVGATSAASGTVTIDADARRGVVQLNVADANAGRSYQMWMMDRSGKLVSATEVEVDDQGQGMAAFQLDLPFDDYDSVHIKAMPVDLGNAEPNGADTLSGDLSSIGSPDTGTIIPQT